MILLHVLVHIKQDEWAQELKNSCHLTTWRIEGTKGEAQRVAIPEIIPGHFHIIFTRVRPERQRKPTRMYIVSLITSGFSSIPDEIFFLEIR